MPSGGSYYLSELPDPVIRIVCEKCGRRGQYRKKTLLAKLGDIKAPDVPPAIAQCPRYLDYSDLCKVTFDR